MYGVPGWVLNLIDATPAPSWPRSDRATGPPTCAGRPRHCTSGTWTTRRSRRDGAGRSVWSGFRFSPQRIARRFRVGVGIAATWRNASSVRSPDPIRTACRTPIACSSGWSPGSVGSRRWTIPCGSSKTDSGAWRVRRLANTGVLDPPNDPGHNDAEFAGAWLVIDDRAPGPVDGGSSCGIDAQCCVHWSSCRFWRCWCRAAPRRRPW